MRRLILVLSIALSALWPAAAWGEAPCPPRLDALRGFLERAVIVLEREVAGIQGDTVLSDATRGEFVQSGEWVIAWLRDQSARLATTKECGDLPRRIEDVHAQIVPMAVLSWGIRMKRLAWELDRVTGVLAETSSAAPPERQAAIHEVTELFSSARAMLAENWGTAFPEAFRRDLRRAVFLARQGLRTLRIRGILE